MTFDVECLNFLQIMHYCGSERGSKRRRNVALPTKMEGLTSAAVCVFAVIGQSQYAELVGEKNNIVFRNAGLMKFPCDLCRPFAAATATSTL
jgi:ABC-type spermidine/putrescine transport system permease subunit I